jgi:hypothetical protein
MNNSGRQRRCYSSRFVRSLSRSRPLRSIRQIADVPCRSLTFVDVYPARAAWAAANFATGMRNGLQLT